MKINLSTYKDKLYACWLGKNIGGTMGTPYEGARQMNDIKGFVTEANVVLPNDDLDLQLVWLLAIEKCGIGKIDAKLLGEFWLSYITPHWNEYGIGKANMKLGIAPPLSGECFNTWRDSNGAWIRTEIWASLAPGAPDVAMKYAYEDACVDHGTAEGTIAAMFVAALESAAYVENDRMKLIDVALSKIPEESRVAKSIRYLLELYAKGVDYKEAREEIRKQNEDIGDGWFEAPSNVAYTVLGLLWGEGDFKKSMIYAINCGDDTDCTGATIGALLGIMGGMAAIPEDWAAHIGDAIVTVSIANGCIFGKVPATCTELSERVISQVGAVLDYNKTGISIVDGESEIPENIAQRFIEDDKFAKELSARASYTYREDFAYATALVTLQGEPKIEAGGAFRVHVKFINNYDEFGAPPYLLKFRWLMPEGFTVKGPKSVILPEFSAHYNGEAEVDFEITAPEAPEAVNRIVLEAMAEGRFTAAYLPVVLLC